MKWKKKKKKNFFKIDKKPSIICQFFITSM